MGILRARYAFADVGLLILRIGIGLMFIFHGWPKLAGGPEKWAQVGKTMELVGINFMHEFWGFMAGSAEAVGGALVMLGLLYRPACALLTFTMLVATMRHISVGDGFGGYSHALEAAILFFSLIFIGPGKYSLDSLLFPPKLDRSVFTG
ncbi:DoxX family protein [Botryobacter ruber]|uniref:DoxX family protein n=1 Tax=Botryobacter ruber TaxID=2171629 RepID=UPI000E0A9EBF|nr:DoxX family protein [Botryobacter ruber]